MKYKGEHIRLHSFEVEYFDILKSDRKWCLKCKVDVLGKLRFYIARMYPSLEALQLNTSDYVDEAREEILGKLNRE
jgi:hypothetical protein